MTYSDLIKLLWVSSVLSSCLVKWFEFEYSVMYSYCTSCSIQSGTQRNVNRCIPLLSLPIWQCSWTLPTLSDFVFVSSKKDMGDYLKQICHCCSGISWNHKYPFLVLLALLCTIVLIIWNCFFHRQMITRNLPIVHCIWLYWVRSDFCM